MKVRVALAMILLLILSPCCLAQMLPDLQISLNVSGDCQFTDYAYSDDYTCNVWVYGRNSQSDTGASQWLLECIECGFSVQKQLVDGYCAYRIQDAQGLYALLFPNYDGMVMLMVQQDLPYAPDAPAPDPTAQPVPQSSTGATSGSHLETILVEVDCPSCHGGSCSICNGTGTYRLYGEVVFCPPRCSSCDGVGSYLTTQTILVYN